MSPSLSRAPSCIDKCLLCFRSSLGHFQKPSATRDGEPVYTWSVLPSMSLSFNRVTCANDFDGMLTWVEWVESSSSESSVSSWPSRLLRLWLKGWQIRQQFNARSNVALLSKCCCRWLLVLFGLLLQCCFISCCYCNLVVIIAVLTIAAVAIAAVAIVIFPSGYSYCSYCCWFCCYCCGC